MLPVLAAAGSSSIMDIQTVQYDVLSCWGCSIRPEARSPVPGHGNPTSRIVIVGRNPGSQEDATGIPFVGRAGEMLDATLTACKVRRDFIWITNLAKCYTTANRVPLAIEYATCMQKHLLQEVLALKPILMVALGGDAFHFLTGVKLGITKVRRKLYSLGGSDGVGTQVIGILHPSAAMRSTSNRGMFESDWHWLAGMPLFQEAYFAGAPRLSLPVFPPEISITAQS